MMTGELSMLSKIFLASLSLYIMGLQKNVVQPLLTNIIFMCLFVCFFFFFFYNKTERQIDVIFLKCC